jgi:hypothetical protein
LFEDAVERFDKAVELEKLKYVPSLQLSQMPH